MEERGRKRWRKMDTREVGGERVCQYIAWHRHGIALHGMFAFRRKRIEVCIGGERGESMPFALHS